MHIKIAWNFGKKCHICFFKSQFTLKGHFERPRFGLWACILALRACWTGLQLLMVRLRPMGGHVRTCTWLKLVHNIPCWCRQNDQYHFHSNMIYFFRRKKTELRNNVGHRFSALSDKFGFLHLKNGDRNIFASQSLVASPSDLYKLGKF